MMSLFYDHLIDIVPVRSSLEAYLTPEEAAHVLALLDEAHHHAVMETILLALPPADHDAFVAAFAANPASPSLLDFLRSRSPLIEESIRVSVEESNRRFLDGIHP